MDKYLSIITNFGCHFKCPYCIVKNNNLNIPKSTLSGLDTLVDNIKKYNCNYVSLSGGGDPLYRYDKNKQYYDKLFDIIPKDVKLELHTSYIVINAPYEKFDRVVYHLHNINQLKTIKKHKNEIVRVVFVVTKDLTNDLIDYIAQYCHSSSEIDELSFRQMVDKNYETTYYCYDYLVKGHKKLWYYIEQNDYNLYYCENKIYTQYKQIGK